MKNLTFEVEALEHKRSKWLMVNLLGFCVWNGLRITEHYLLDNPSYPLLTGIMLLGWLCWALSLFRIFQLGKQMKHNKQLLKILNDELTELNRFKTWRIALLAVAITQVLIILWASFVSEISGLLAAELSIFVLVVSCIGSFLYLNTESHAGV